jgi:acid phosphatase family membrane protein YuiD
MAFGMGIIHDANLFEIVRHPWFISAFLAGGAAQLLKFVIGCWRTRRLDLSYLAGAGGMPSSHSALVSALATAVGLTEGFDAPDAMIAVGFGLLVLCDAATLRRAAGEHAKLLNRIVAKLNDGLDEADRLEAERLRERLGHSRREVIAGMLFGIAVAFFVCAVWDFWKV